MGLISKAVHHAVGIAQGRDVRSKELSRGAAAHSAAGRRGRGEKTSWRGGGGEAPSQSERRRWPNCNRGSRAAAVQRESGHAAVRRTEGQGVADRGV